MINSKKDLQYYISCDQRALGIKKPGIAKHIKAHLLPQIWYVEYLMRKLEYAMNCSNKKNPFAKLRIAYLDFRFKSYSIKLGYSLHPNVFGPGLCLAHIGTIVVNANCRFGSNARIHVDVNIGQYTRGDEDFEKRKDEAPSFGNNVYIGPGAKIFGSISIGDDVAIGANSVVTKDVESHVTVAGAPAKVINSEGSVGLYKHGDLNY